MTPALWQAVLAIAAGSIAGALLRQATIVLLPNSATPTSLRFTVSGLGGALLGAVLGSIATMATTDSTWQQIAMITLVAALGTFAAAAVLSTGLISSKTANRLRHAAILHIATTLVSAALGVGLALWWRTR
jgi:fluoride ion exporter CrcB/FEX